MDSSVLLQVYEGVDVLDLISEEVGRCEYFVLDTILNELSRISSSSKGLRGKAAGLALEYIQRRGVEIINTGSFVLSGDESLLHFFKGCPSARHDFIVATNDEGLKKELLRLGVRVVSWWSSKFRFVLITP